MSESSLRIATRLAILEEMTEKLGCAFEFENKFKKNDFRKQILSNALIKRMSDKLTRKRILRPTRLIFNTFLIFLVKFSNTSTNFKENHDQKSEAQYFDR